MFNRMLMASANSLAGFNLSWNGAMSNSHSVGNAGLTLTRTGASGSHKGGVGADVITEKVYMEFDVVQAAADNGNFGDGWLVGVTAATGGWDPTSGSYLGSNGASAALYGFNGSIVGASSAYSGAQVFNGQIIGLAVDPVSGLAWFRQGVGSYIGGGNPAAGTAPSATGLANALVIAGDLYNRYQTIGVRTVLAGSVPSGFMPLTG